MTDLHDFPNGEFACACGAWHIKKHTNMTLRKALTFALERVDERTGVRSDVTFCDMTEGVHHKDCRWCALSKVLESKDMNEMKAEAYDQLMNFARKMGQL